MPELTDRKVFTLIDAIEGVTITTEAADDGFVYRVATDGTIPPRVMQILAATDAPVRMDGTDLLIDADHVILTVTEDAADIIDSWGEMDTMGQVRLAENALEEGLLEVDSVSEVMELMETLQGAIDYDESE